MQQDMAIVNLKVSVPEAVKALAKFKQNRVKALEDLSADIKGAVSSAINGLLHAEMNVFLGEPDQADNKRNGYEDREYALKHVGAIRIALAVEAKSLHGARQVGHEERMEAERETGVGGRGPQRVIDRVVERSPVDHGVRTEEHRHHAR